jgi:hypothetical protein
MTKETIRTLTGVLRMREDGILHAKLRRGARVTLEDAKRSLASVPPVLAGNKHLLLVDFGGLQSMTREAREYYAGEEAAQRIAATALVAPSPIGRVIGSFFLGFNKTRMPLRLFATETEAVQWLKGFMD